MKKNPIPIAESMLIEPIFPNFSPLYNIITESVH
jgi:hypothetical protein